MEKVREFLKYAASLLPDPDTEITLQLKQRYEAIRDEDVYQHKVITKPQLKYEDIEKYYQIIEKNTQEFSEKLPRQFWSIIPRFKRSLIDRYDFQDAFRPIYDLDEFICDSENYDPDNETSEEYDPVIKANLLFDKQQKTIIHIWDYQVPIGSDKISSIIHYLENEQPQNLAYILISVNSNQKEWIKKIIKKKWLSSKVRHCRLRSIASNPLLLTCNVVSLPSMIVINEQNQICYQGPPNISLLNTQSYYQDNKLNYKSKWLPTYKQWDKFQNCKETKRLYNLQKNQQTQFEQMLIGDDKITIIQFQFLKCMTESISLIEECQKNQFDNCRYNLIWISKENDFDAIIDEAILTKYDGIQQYCLSHQEFTKYQTALLISQMPYILVLDKNERIQYGGPINTYLSIKNFTNPTFPYLQSSIFVQNFQLKQKDYFLPLTDLEQYQWVDNEDVFASGIILQSDYQHPTTLIYFWDEYISQQNCRQGQHLGENIHKNQEVRLCFLSSYQNKTQAEWAQQIKDNKWSNIGNHYRFLDKKKSDNFRKYFNINTGQLIAIDQNNIIKKKGNLNIQDLQNIILDDLSNNELQKKTNEEQQDNNFIISETEFENGLELYQIIKNKFRKSELLVSLQGSLKYQRNQQIYSTYNIVQIQYSPIDQCDTQMIDNLESLLNHRHYSRIHTFDKQYNLVDEQFNNIVESVLQQYMIKLGFKGTRSIYWGADKFEHNLVAKISVKLNKHLSLDDFIQAKNALLPFKLKYLHNVQQTLDGIQKAMSKQTTLKMIPLEQNYIQLSKFNLKNDQATQSIICYFNLEQICELYNLIYQLEDINRNSAKLNAIYIPSQQVNFNIKRLNCKTSWCACKMGFNNITSLLDYIKLDCNLYKPIKSYLDPDQSDVLQFNVKSCPKILQFDDKQNLQFNCNSFSKYFEYLSATTKNKAKKIKQQLLENEVEEIMDLIVSKQAMFSNFKLYMYLTFDFNFKFKKDSEKNVQIYSPFLEIKYRKHLEMELMDIVQFLKVIITEDNIQISHYQTFDIIPINKQNSCTHEYLLRSYYSVDMREYYCRNCSWFFELKDQYLIYFSQSMLEDQSAVRKNMPNDFYMGRSFYKNHFVCSGTCNNNLTKYQHFYWCITSWKKYSPILFCEICFEGISDPSSAKYQEIIIENTYELNMTDKFMLTRFKTSKYLAQYPEMQI